MQRGFASFCNILISLVPYSYSVLALTYPRGLARESALGVRTHGRCLHVQARGEAGVSWWGGDEVASLSWSQAGTAQIHTKEQFRPVNTPQTHPSSSELSFLSLCLCLLRKVLLLLLLRCPESRMPRNHSGASLALPHQPLARPNPGFSCLGLRTVRFFSLKMFSKESVDYSYSALKMHFKK